MELKVKKLNICTGKILVAVINKKDAVNLDLHSMDRIKIICDGQIETVILDTTESDSMVPLGRIGIFREVEENLKLKNNQNVEIRLARKPLSIDYIKKKLDGHKLNKHELHQIIWDIVHNKLTDIEMTYFVAACYSNVLDDIETVHLIDAMTREGNILKLDRYPVVDKHCIGGVAGNRTSMLIVPILAAAGVTIPKTSSRSITSPAGTADTMEVLCNVKQSLPQMKRIVESINGCLVWGGSLNLAPADDKIIKVERPLVIDAESQLIASILSKKLSVSSTHILIDIPVGKGAKVSSKKAGKDLKKDFEKFSRKLGIKIRAIITDGSAPIGNGIGPSLEARDVLYVLKNDHRQPMDLRDKGIMMAGKMLEMAKKARRYRGQALAKKILESGAAYKKMCEIIDLQGCRIKDPSKIKVSKYTHTIRASTKGVINRIDNKCISKIARIAGAPENPLCGLMLRSKVGDHVTKGKPLFTIYAGSTGKLENVLEILEKEHPYHIHY